MNNGGGRQPRGSHRRSSRAVPLILATFMLLVGVAGCKAKVDYGALTPPDYRMETSGFSCVGVSIYSDTPEGLIKALKQAYHPDFLVEITGPGAAECSVLQIVLRGEPIFAIKDVKRSNEIELKRGDDGKWRGVFGSVPTVLSGPPVPRAERLRAFCLQAQQETSYVGGCL